MSVNDQVIKRDGRRENFSFDKILSRVKSLGKRELNVNYSSLVQKIIDRLYDGIPTTQIDELTAQQCAALSPTHHHYGKLASRIMVSNHHKNTPNTFKEVVEKLYNFHDSHGKHHPLVASYLYELVCSHHEKIEEMIDYKRDYLIDFFGFKTLERAYFLRIGGEILERPQHMWMRVSLAIHRHNMEKVKETYDCMSQRFFTHATPTLFNSGTPREQLSSCYLLSMKDDSIDGIYETLSDCAKISKWAGGIGLHIHNIRASGSHIRGTNGTSNGIVPMLRVYNDTARYVDQGGGKRNGSFAIYLEPWHGDIYSFLDLKKTHGDEESRARDLFYALWIPDLFMKRVAEGENGKWTLMCPDQCPGLSDVYGEKFDTLYTKYESEGRGKTIKARDLWFKILESQIETGTPYMLYKDACNKKSNQKNLGTIKSSNLCTEIIEYSDENETAVCNLASIGLSKFVITPEYAVGNITIYSKTACHYCTMAKNHLKKFNLRYADINVDNNEERTALYQKFSEETGKTINSVPMIVIDGEYIGGYAELANKYTYKFDYELLHAIVKIATENLNRVIDVNYYPTPKTKLSNMRHRPIGLGVQGLADVFALMNVPFHSEEAQDINKKIFETMYHAALEKSNELSAQFGAYSTFKGSPASQGLLQFDLWEAKPSNRYDWKILKKKIFENGLRNSLLLAPMPTASTSQILGNNECFEPFTSLIYVRRTIAGEFIVANKYVMEELIGLGIWNEELKNSIIAHQGSIQHLTEIPKCIRDKYKIVWEMPMKYILTLARDRGIYIDQSQSTNLWMKDPTYKKLTAMHFYAWKCGLKTGIYYLRTKAKAQPQQFTIDPSQKVIEEEEEGCEMCSG